MSCPTDGCAWTRTARPSAATPSGTSQLKGKGRTSDPDADWGMHAHRGVDRRTGRTWERISRWFGYKLRLVAGTRHELPMAFSVEKISASEHKVLHRDLEFLFRCAPGLAKHCRTFRAGRDRSGGPLNAWLWVSSHQAGH